MLKLSAGFLAVLMLAGCAGRTPQPMPLVLASDQQLDCDAIEAEAKINERRIADLGIEQGWKMGQNAVAGVVGFMVWPAWLGLDLQDAAGQEAKALSQRNEYLLTLAKDRCRPATQTASASIPLAKMAAAPSTDTLGGTATLMSSAGLTTSLVEH